MLFGIGAILTLHAPAAAGQDSAATWGFVNARYDTRSSASIYSGYGWRHAFAMGGVLHNPRSGYAELTGGMGVVFRTGADAEHWLALASARADALSYGQIYWLSTVRTGPVTTRANVKWTVAYERGAGQKLAIFPLSMTLPVGRHLAGGAAMDMSAATGARTSIGTGLELRLRLPGAALVANALRDTPENSSRLRLLFISMF